MAVLINWSDEAKTTFENNIKYLEEHWSEKEIKKFVSQTNYILKRIMTYPEMYSRSKKNRFVRKAGINKHIVLYYRYSPSIDQVILLTFWHNKQNPDKLRW